MSVEVISTTIPVVMSELSNALANGAAVAASEKSATEKQIVMADIVSQNDERQLAGSVVEPSTTDADEKNNLEQRTASGDKTTTNYRNPGQAQATFTIDNTAAVDGGSGEHDGEMEKVNLDEGKNIDSDSGSATRSGSVSPTKTDSIKPADRKAGAKKPSFKPVSLNKQFLKDVSPSAGTAVTSLSSTIISSGASAFSNAPSPALRTSSASKLKLVKASATSQSLRPGNIGSPSSTRVDPAPPPVWNKNKPVQPAAPAPTKDITDEELKKQFGIHLANRLGSDDTNKEAKWADIDPDDDDDWVPETIEWNDGMKITLSVEESAPSVTDAAANLPAMEPEPVQQPEVKEAPRARSPIFPSEGGGRPKMLVTEKIVPKNNELPSQGPRTAPWAKFTPPVPAPISLGNVNQQRGPERREYTLEQSIHGPAPMREVPTDVYDRSWRDRAPSRNFREKELFNSETGQLEPVQEGRNRGPRSLQGDMQMNKPAVLQRPPGQNGPAEPSAAFQQHRGNIYRPEGSHHRSDGPWNRPPPDDFRRRRTSSNVSGGSASTGRRPSFNRYEGSEGVPFGPSSRNGSIVGHNSPFDDGAAPRGGYPGPPGPYSPSFQHVLPQYREVSPRMTHAVPIRSSISPAPVSPIPQVVVPDTPVVSVPPAIIEDPVNDQARIMKEKREKARKRRLEEEANAEAEKNARLKVKLEELAAQAKAREEAAAAEKKAAEEKLEAERKAAEEIRLAEEAKRAEERRIVEEKAAAERKAADERAEEKRKIVAEKAAEEEAVRKAAEAKAAEENLTNERARPGQHSDRYVRPFGRSQSPVKSSSSNAPQAQTGRSTLSTQTQRPQDRNAGFSNNRDNRDSRQSWKSGYSNWSPSANNNQNSTASSPWGAIGEKPRTSAASGAGGAFVANRYVPKAQFQQRESAAVGGAGGAFVANRYASRAQREREERSRGGYQGLSSDRPNLDVSDKFTPDQRSAAVGAWNALSTNIEVDEAETRVRNREARIAREAEAAASGIKSELPSSENIVEVWRKTVVNEETGELRTEFVEKTNLAEAMKRSEEALKKAETAAPTVVPAPVSTPEVPPVTEKLPVPSGSTANRPPSRVFPTMDAVLSHIGDQDKPAEQAAKSLDTRGSPPPPMSAEHPVHGDRNTRVVQLPPSHDTQHHGGRISPPCRTSGNWKHESRPPRASGYDVFEAVQMKILAAVQKHSPPQQPTKLLPHAAHQRQGPWSALQEPLKPNLKEAVSSKDFSVSKPSFDDAPEGSKSVTVSLPGKSDSQDSEKSSGNTSPVSAHFLSKPDDEEFFHELFQRDFGSTPTVKIPHLPSHVFHPNNHNNSNHHHKSPASSSVQLNKAKKTTNLRFDQTAQSVECFAAFEPKDFENGEGKRFVPVRLPGKDQLEVICRGQDGRKKKGFGGGRKTTGGRGFGGNGGMVRGMGRGVGRKMGELVQ
ncbi:hypothetical protein RUND412_001319 [Rhizina undulata]